MASIQEIQTAVARRFPGPDYGLRVAGRSVASPNGLLVHAVSVALVGVVHLVLADPKVTLIAGGAVVFCTYLYLGLCEAKKATLWLSPLCYYFFWYSIGLGASALYLGWTIPAGGELPFSVVFVSASDLATGYVIYLIGSVALHAGMRVARPSRQKCDWTGPMSGRTFSNLFRAWALGILVHLFANQLSFCGSIVGMFKWLPHSAVCAVALIPREKLRLSKAQHLVVMALGTASLVAINSQFLSKATLMLSFLPVVWMAVQQPAIRKWRWPLAFALVILYFAAVAPTVTWLRTREDIQRAAPLQRIRSMARAMLSGEVYSVYGQETFSFSTSANHFLYRQFDPTPVGYIVSHVRENGFQRGATMEYITYAFIPRFLWPNKPNVSRGAWFTVHLGFARTEEEASTSTGITATGEWYWNFGLIGVVAGMCLIGRLFGHLWWLAGDDPRTQPMHMLLYVLVMMQMPDMAEAIAAIVGLVATYLVFRFVLMNLDGRLATNSAAHRLQGPLVSSFGGVRRT